ncbi:hypothetical protein EDB86DRAFT_2272357 [Lactarius hatsudake]|nr:hypothetical protein EDB86DRAFT_2272357 [Lactarius hatsudake]
MGPLLGFSSSLSSVNTAETLAFPPHLWARRSSLTVQYRVNISSSPPPNRSLLKMRGPVTICGWFHCTPLRVTRGIIRAALSSAWGDDEATQPNTIAVEPLSRTRTQLGRGGRKAHSAIKLLALLLSNGGGGVCLRHGTFLGGHVRFTVSHLFSEAIHIRRDAPFLSRILVPVLPICIVSWARHCGRRIVHRRDF